MQRPTGVTVLALLAFIGAGILVLGALGMFWGGAMMSGMMARPGSGVWMAGAGAMMGIMFLGFAALELIVGLGLWKLQNWARIMAIVLAGLGLLGSVFSIFSPFAHMHFFFFAFLIRRLIVAAIEVWILVYLFKPHVKQAFGATGF
jgi:uncharacterized membrane protein (DUF2068 family)